MRCETGEFPIKIIQGDSYRRVYKFYDTDGNVMDNSSISSVILSVSRLNYTQTLNWNASEEGYVFMLSADTTAEFPYCKGTYDVTLHFRDTQVSTQVYQSSWQIFEKDVFYNTITNNNGYMTCENSEVVIKTGITVSAGGAGGTDDHNLLYNRNLPNQHPMSAITGLEDALEGKADSGDIPTKTSDLTNDSNFVNQDYVADVAEGLQDQIDDIEAVISTQATPTNKLVSASEMGDAISAVEAKQLYATSSQGSFATKAQLLSTTTFYNADGTVATPTKNDIAYVLADESHSGKSAKYVVADITSSGIVWGFVITFSDTTFSQTQMDAINSGVTQQKVSAYDSHIANKSNPHEVTYQQLGGTNPSYTKGETDTLLDGKLSDAPSDGKQYARKDGAWSEVESGGYEPPVGGIPKTDLASDVQESLEKADSALQSVPNTFRTAAAQDIIDASKQDAISDLASIRSGAALGATALQSVPNTYRTAAQQDIIDNGKVDKVTGKGLSTNDYTNADKAKVESALTDDDTEEAEQIEIDSAITEGSTNLITSGAVYAALGNVEAAINAIRGVV